MKLDVTVDVDALRALSQSGPAFVDAANAAVQRQTDETRGAMRAHVAQRLGARTANALGRKLFVNQDQTVTGVIHSRWWRRGAGGGPREDVLAAFAEGRVITAKRSRFLAIPLPAAYAVAGVGGRRGAKKPTPEAVETALDQDLFVIRRPGRPPILCARNVAISGSRRGTIRAARRRNQAGALTRRRTADAVVPLFVLLRNVRLPKRLEFAPIVEQGEGRLGEKLIVELGRRGVL